MRNLNILALLLLVGCSNHSSFKNIEAPPDIPTSYYLDSTNNCSYKSIESTIEPILDNNGHCKSKESLNLKYRNIRYKTINHKGVECEYVLASYENGKTKRINSKGEPLCDN